MENTFFFKKLRVGFSKPPLKCMVFYGFAYKVFVVTRILKHLFEGIEKRFKQNIY